MIKRAAAILVLLVGCGGGGSTHQDASIDGAAHDGPGTHDAAHDASIDAPPSGPMLTVKNYLSWCSVTVNGGAPSAMASQTVTVIPGMITVSAVALAGFQLGATPWHDTDGDTGSGEAGTITGTGQSASSAAKVTVGTSPKCAWVCCEFTGGGGCPATDQCL